MITSEIQGAVTVITPAGSLNGELAEGMLETVESQLGQGFPQVVLDASHVALIDSAGLEALLDVRDAVRSRGGVIKLAGPTPLVADILIATGVSDHFERFDNAKAAVGSFSR